ncbi:MAG: 3' terminal RNA ribose 2'-O-methyltransferase Hen1 [Polyangiales bacterium]
MFLQIECTTAPATDLSWIAHKHPDKAQSFALSFGVAHVFYPAATEARCAIAVAVEVDPVALSRGREGARSTTPLEPYVNDRPYVASSMLSTTIAQVLGSALNGRCEKRPELVERALDLRAILPVIAARSAARGDELIRRLFAPLGYELELERLPLDTRFTDWGESPYWSVTLSARTTVRSLLEHLYVLLPVLDDAQHYWVSEADVEKLLSKGERWLSAHPERELVTARYLKHQRSLEELARARMDADGAIEPGTEDRRERELEQRWEGSESAAKVPLDAQRREWVRDQLAKHRARRVVDLGCGEAKLVTYLAQHSTVAHITGVDVSPQSLMIAQKRVDKLGPSQRERVTLLQGSLIYRDARLQGFDAATVMEVIEHLEPELLPWLEDAVFAVARPPLVLLSTPNAEANAAMPGIPLGAMRHSDHRFEWDRATFRAWAERVASEHGYVVSFEDIGEAHAELGPPTQAAVFERAIDQAHTIKSTEETKGGGR